ncbi:MAG: hypothetical protein OEW58_09135 [Gammaproteobacteria bacterium]|nr:hypothetical protein [Gammaproteobacteria bacterium]
MKKSRFTESQIIVFLNESETWVLITEFYRTHETFYNCLEKYGGMDSSLMKSMKKLEYVNRRLKKMHAALRLKSQVIQEALKKVVIPSKRKEMAQRVLKEKAMSIRFACEMFGISETETVDKTV